MLKMEMFKVQINEVAGHDSYCPVTSHAGWVVVWIVWTGEVSSQAS